MNRTFTNRKLGVSIGEVDNNQFTKAEFKKDSVSVLIFNRPASQILADLPAGASVDISGIADLK